MGGRRTGVAGTASTGYLRGAGIAIIVGVLAGGLAACGGGSGGGDCEGRLTVYSGRTEELIGPILESFNEQSDIDVCVRYGTDSAELALLIDAEGERSEVDVFISQSPGAVGFLAARDRLAPLSEPTLSLVEDRFRSPAGVWVGLTGRVRTLVYNTDLVDPATLPASVLDLTGPDYRDKVGVAPTNGSFQDFVTAARSQLGDDETLAFLEGLADNGARSYANNTAIIEAVGRGEIPFGLVNHYYALQALKENPDLAVANHFFGDGDIGKLILVTAGGVLATSDQPADAEALLHFLLDAESQTYFSEQTLEYPLAAGVAPTGELAAQPLSSIVTANGDLASLGGELEATAALIKQSGLGS